MEIGMEFLSILFPNTISFVFGISIFWNPRGNKKDSISFIVMFWYVFIAVSSYARNWLRGVIGENFLLDRIFYYKNKTIVKSKK